MNLLYISPSIIPSKSANSVHVMRMCNAFANKSLKVELLCKTNAKQNDNLIFDFYGIKFKSFKVKALYQRNENKLNSFLYAIWTFFKTFKTYKVNIYSRSQLSSVLILLFSFKRIFIELYAPPSGFYKLIFRFFLKKNRISKIIVISNELKKIISNDLDIINDNILLVCHDGADEIKNIKSNINFKKNKIDVGYVGHLYKGRGIELILELAKRNINVKFHLIGGNNYDINFWKKKNKSNNIIFHGHIQPKLVPSYLRKFDILIAPYQNKVLISNGLNTVKWMSPLKIFEYMSAKKPILTSNLTVIKEVLEHKKNSYLCDPNDFEEWNDGLNFLINNFEFSNIISKQAFLDFKSKYTWMSRSDLILKYFE